MCLYVRSCQLKATTYFLFSSLICQFFFRYASFDTIIKKYYQSTMNGAKMSLNVMSPPLFLLFFLNVSILIFFLQIFLFCLPFSYWLWDTVSIHRHSHFLKKKKYSNQRLIKFTKKIGRYDCFEFFDFRNYWKYSRSFFLLTLFCLN